MKKSLLFIAASLTLSTAFAQYGNNSVVFNGAQANTERVAMDVAPHKFQNNFTANKPTGGAKEGWFSYVNVMATTNVKGWYSNMYNDTTTKTSTGTFNKTHGNGFSFDPYSKAWDTYFVDINSIPGFVLSSTTAYTVDSVFVSGFYNRLPYNNYTDTLIIDVFRTGGGSTFTLQNGPSATLADNSDDSTVRFFTGTYDADNNKMSDSINAASAGSLVRITKLLDAAFFADSSGTRSHSQAFQIPGGLSVTAGQGVVMYVHYKSGHVYPFGKLVDSVNTWRAYSYELSGDATNPKQVGKERNCGMVSTWQSRYAPYYIPYQGHKMIIPTVFYDATAGNDWPDYSFYVKCANCENAGVTNVTGVISNVKAYPNPADNNVSVPVTVAKAANVQVSLINTVGQQVAVQDLGKVAAGQTATANFFTGSLPAGIYVYTVNADGQRMTGRVVVTH